MYKASVLEFGKVYTFDRVGSLESELEYCTN